MISISMICMIITSLVNISKISMMIISMTNMTKMIIINSNRKALLGHLCYLP